MNNKVHLTKEGLYQIINIKTSMNLGLSDMLKSEFNEYIPVERPVINTENIPDPYWIAGFVSGEGNFSVNITKSTNKIGKRVQLRFRVTQHERDLKLLEVLIKYLGTGSIYKYPNQPARNFFFYCLISLIYLQITKKMDFMFKKRLLSNASMQHIGFTKLFKRSLGHTDLFYNKNFTGFNAFFGTRHFSTSKPVIVYSNTDTERLKILKENRGKSGVYCWKNNLNGNTYIGSSIELSKRFIQYFNTKYLLLNNSMAICRALIKYGNSNFSLEIL
uniref:GIY-YIG domain-containing protein n=1 Tax=Arthrobotrys musiformis TaxID=47236 RepID=A0A482EBH2_9PEZI|nr:hypothetical protein [Arthrobotrys musiformis]